MDNQTKNCSQCGEKDRCGQIFETLGNSKGPSIAGPVVWAFLTPMVVFILSLAGAHLLLRGRFEDKMLTMLTFFAASAVTLAAIVMIRAIRSPNRNKSKIKH